MLIRGSLARKLDLAVVKWKTSSFPVDTLGALRLKARRIKIAVHKQENKGNARFIVLSIIKGLEFQILKCGFVITIREVFF